MVGLTLAAAGGGEVIAEGVGVGLYIGEEGGEAGGDSERASIYDRHGGGGWYKNDRRRAWLI